MARLVNRNTGEKCDECKDCNEPVQLAEKTIVLCAKRIALCKPHLKELFESLADYATQYP